ncbi:hypothetical protein HNO88_000526 [Novosphingobium chloroacetimidivorans]|uniref:Uncharacterized protein n=1 Tax=Novosphingobium chloroacetimidivorans TaxID=1428314 RepID=A0A7W7K6M4_9SPHN|nr:hypothetical protein [Novosphingobium chloroacetimidivorans]MBB4857219.1 hypothetical protein [Novosphingobium chloroacetimidivorans]
MLEQAISPTSRASLAEQSAIAQELARGCQTSVERAVELARIIKEAADDLPPDCERRRFYACADLIEEAATSLGERAEAIEIICGTLLLAVREASNA